MKVLKTTLFLAFILLLAEVRAQTGKLEKEDNTIYTTVEIPPSLSNEYGSLSDYLKKNTVYPEAYRKFGYKDLILVKFVVEKDGSVSKTEFLTEGRGEFMKEAMRVIENMPCLNPALQDGEPRRTYFTIPIKFCPEGCSGW